MSYSALNPFALFKNSFLLSVTVAMLSLPSSRQAKAVELIISSVNVCQVLSKVWLRTVHLALKV